MPTIDTSPIFYFYIHSTPSRPPPFEPSFASHLTLYPDLLRRAAARTTNTARTRCRTTGHTTATATATVAAAAAASTRQAWTAAAVAVATAGRE